MKARFLILLAMSSLATQAKDITQQIIDKTDYDELVEAACFAKCGNRGSSELQSVSIVPAGQGFHSVTAKGRGKFHQLNNGVTLFGQKVSGINLKYKIQVMLLGTLSEKDCMLKVDHIRIVGDKYGLAKGAKSEIGKSHLIENCRAFL